MKIETHNIYGIELKETENGFTFASSACKLDFKPNGTLRGMTIGDLSLTERSDAKPVAITTGGNYRSTIDPTGKNKNWASLTGENMAHETPDMTLKNARLVRTMLTVELHLTLDCGKVEIEDIFALKQGEKRPHAEIHGHEQLRRSPHPQKRNAHPPVNPRRHRSTPCRRLQTRHNRNR